MGMMNGIVSLVTQILAYGKRQSHNWGYSGPNFSLCLQDGGGPENFT
jgi:hypothetical protein